MVWIFSETYWVTEWTGLRHCSVWLGHKIYGCLYRTSEIRMLNIQWKCIKLWNSTCALGVVSSSYLSEHLYQARLFRTVQIHGMNIQRKCRLFECRLGVCYTTDDSFEGCLWNHGSRRELSKFTSKIQWDFHCHIVVNRDFATFKLKCCWKMFKAY
jgi:hypothetical protein